jgi:hypothetical protein
VTTEVTVTTSTAVVQVVSPAASTVTTSGAATATVSVAPAVIWPSAIRYTADFTATGLAYSGTGVTAPGYNSYYVKHGQMVMFYIEINCMTVSNFGTGQFKTSLPFTPLTSGNHFAGWIWRDPAIPADDANHIVLNVDTLGVTSVLDMHFLVGAPANPKPVIENQLKQGAPGYNLTTVSKIYISGSYISGE